MVEGEGSRRPPPSWGGDRTYSSVRSALDKLELRVFS